MTHRDSFTSAARSLNTKEALMAFSIGDRVKDIITGFSGIIVAHTRWLYGCDRYLVQPEKLKEDGTPLDSANFDEPQLKLMKAGVIVPPDLAGPERAATRTGGPMPAPKRRAYPSR